MVFCFRYLKLFTASWSGTTTVIIIITSAAVNDILFVTTSTRMLNSCCCCFCHKKLEFWISGFLKISREWTEVLEIRWCQNDLILKSFFFFRFSFSCLDFWIYYFFWRYLGNQIKLPEIGFLDFLSLAISWEWKGLLEIHLWQNNQILENFSYFQKK